MHLDLLELDVYREYTSRPERLRDLLAGSPGKRTVIIDEIQKAPSLLDEVHSLMEKDKRLQFILTGSSSRKLKRSGADLLAGRAVLTALHPFMAAGLGKRFALSQALSLGTLPLIVDAADPEATLRSYAALYLKEEVQAEGMVRNIGSFARFLETMSFSHGEVLNLSHVSREAQVERKTAEGYLEILVLQHLRAWNDYGGGRHTLSYWRTRAGNEVDLVVYGETEFAAIEVKNSPRVRPEDFSGLESFGEDYPQARRLILHRGSARLESRGILCMPCEEFLASLVPGKPLPN